jgi:hypothetical protein
MEQFIKDFGTSPLIPKAKEILSVKPNNLDSLDFGSKPYARVDSIPHYFVAVFQKNQMQTSELDRIYTEFKNNYYKQGLEYSTKNIDLSDTTFLYVKKQFNNYADAKVYLEKLEHFHEFGEHLKNKKYAYYLMTEQSYNKLVSERDPIKFEEFYQKEYGVSPKKGL